MTPTIGRIVWYRSASMQVLPELADQPLAAIVTAVFDGAVNLLAIDHAGVSQARTRVEQGDADGQWTWPTQITDDKRDSLTKSIAETRLELAREEAELREANR